MKEKISSNHSSLGLRYPRPFAPVCATSAVCTSLRCCGPARAAGARPSLAGAAGGSAVRGDASAWGHVQRGFIFPILGENIHRLQTAQLHIRTESKADFRRLGLAARLSAVNDLFTFGVRHFHAAL